MSRAVPPSLGAPARLTLPRVARHRLANGLDVLLVERRELPVVDVQLVIRAGAYGDTAAHAGRAWMTAELLDQGTDGRTATQIADEAELLGASLQTRGSWDFCTTALHVLTHRLGPALELLADVMLRPTFPEAELERRRELRLAAIMQDASEPRVLAANALADALYGADHPFGRPIGGLSETVRSLSRAGLVDFYSRRFAPENAYLIAVGDVDAEQLLPLIDGAFAGWSRRTAIPATDHKMVPRNGVTVHIVDRPGAPQSEVRVGRRGPPRLVDGHSALVVANSVLGGAFSSRLNMLLREEKAYTYGVSSNFAFRAGGGPFIASTAVFTGATADTVDTIVREMGRLGEQPVPADELERARNYLVLGLPRTFETTGDIAEHVSEVALHGLGDDYYDEYAGRMRAVTAEDVKAAAARWLAPDDLVVVVVGDAAAVRPGLEYLGIGEVHVREGG